MPNYTRSKAQALKIIAKSGQDVTRVAYAAAAYDTTLRKSVQTKTNSTRKGAIFDLGRGVTKLRGELIKKTDRQLLLDAEGPVEASDHFIVDEIDYTIVSIGGVNPAGTQVMYDLHLRA